MRSNAINKVWQSWKRAKPRLIATLADFVIWCAEDEPDKDVEFSPQMHEFVDKTLKHCEEENKATSYEID